MRDLLGLVTQSNTNSSPDLSSLIAAALLVLVLLGYAFWIGWALRRSPYTPVQSLVFFLCVLLCRVLWRARILGRLPLGPGEGGVIVANHRSSVDPFFIQLIAQRRVHWMVAAEFGSNPLIRWIYDFTQVIPTSRSGRDTGATKRAIDLARKGSLVGMFPEGRVNTTELPLLPARPGALLVAAKAGVPIIPVYIARSPYGGTALSPFTRSAQVDVHIGQPIDLSEWSEEIDDRAVLERATQHVLSAVAKLGGHHNFEPELAGRKARSEA